MLLKHIKESIKQKHSNNGNKSLRNNYIISVTNKDRNRWANRKYQLEVRDSIKDRQVNQDLLKTIYKQAKRQGLTRQQVNKIGVLKTMALLRAVDKR